MNVDHEVSRARLEAERIVKAVTDQCIERSRVLRRLAKAEARVAELEALSRDTVERLVRFGDLKFGLNVLIGRHIRAGRGEEIK